MKTTMPWGILFGFCLLLPAVYGRDPSPPKGVSVAIGTSLFELELAVTPEARERGLMFRRHLAPEQGMLFVFPEEKPRGFWMKNTLIDLDIVYLDSEARVVSFRTMTVEPPRRTDESEEQYEERLPLYDSVKPARFAIEFRAGTLSLLDLQPGQRLPIDPDAWVQWAR